SRAGSHEGPRRSARRSLQLWSWCRPLDCRSTGTGPHALRQSCCTITDATLRRKSCLCAIGLTPKVVEPVLGQAAPFRPGDGDARYFYCVISQYVNRLPGKLAATLPVGLEPPWHHTRTTSGRSRPPGCL